MRERLIYNGDVTCYRYGKSEERDSALCQKCEFYDGHVASSIRCTHGDPKPVSKELRTVIKMILCNEFAGIGEELIDNIEGDILKAVKADAERPAFTLISLDRETL